MPNTREKLIELLKESLRAIGGVCNDNICKHCKYEKYGDDCGYAIRADHLIANGVTVQKWIPVSERLPEANVAVLVYDGKFVDGFTFYDLSYVSKYGVTHWMPLPQPPKENDNG